MMFSMNTLRTAGGTRGTPCDEDRPRSERGEPSSSRTSADLLVDQAREALDATTASQPTDSGLGDALDVVPEDLQERLSPTQKRG